MSERAEAERVEELCSTLDELLMIWDDRPEKTSVGRGRQMELPRLAVVLGLASHAHRLARAALHLSKAGMVLEAMPLVRGTLEHGLTAQWMLHNDAEALAGFVNAQRRQRRALGKAMLGVGWGELDEVTEIIENSEVIPSTGDAPARHFEQLCDDFAPLGSSMYVIYRALSGYTHAGHHIVDAYLVPGDTISIRIAPEKPLSTATWLWTLCAGCMWASRAADMLDRDRPHRQALRRIARVLRTPGTPDLHSKAWLRSRGVTRKAKSKSSSA
ncbi:DUF5677 domain-containing protein [Lentzea flaviverrucosa]|uniref:Uncharacterized protein n=1 Tax=Lentzea flaviverrucosa TaxID=200379 RepID=A0A1H9EVC3_9PSEU|nr:DUF5677 domain-containing protein [Lentzea flaviverrucosa]RDI35387.1 hypothetical protein DFR72_1011138 [Lentzea flaviverrucosa]SEQ29527.1 hypothetical protein SAMN05216195_10279 [Lentzea flaviverrucosa]